MSETLPINEKFSLEVSREICGRVEKYSLLPGQEADFTREILRRLKAVYGITNLEVFPAADPPPIQFDGRPPREEPKEILRLCPVFAAQVDDALREITAAIGPKRPTACWLQLVYSEAFDNANNMFGDFLYVNWRLLARH
jgi:hypothetical protein